MKSSLLAGIAILMWANVSGQDAGGGDPGASSPPASDPAPPPSSGSSSDSSSSGTSTTGGDSSDGSSSSSSSGAASKVENSVPAYPPLGEKSAAMDKWTPESIRRNIGSKDEDTLKDRYNLQLALMDSVDEKNASMAGMMKIIDASRAKMLNFAKIEQKVSTTLYADATAGGLVASGRNVKSEIPATQKLLSSTINKQLASLQRDAAAMKNSVLVAETEYRERIKALADTVSSLIAQQDALFARLAAQQARAMARSSQNLANSALRSLNRINSQITDTIKSSVTVAGKAMSGVGTARSALNDVEDSLGEIQSQYQDALQSTVGDVQASVNQQTDKSTAALAKAADSASSAAQAAAMNAGKQLARQLDVLDRNATLTVGQLVDGTVKVTADLTKQTDKTAASAEDALNKASSGLEKSVDGVDSQSQLVSSDQLQILQDMQATLQQQQSMSSETGAGFSTDLSKVNGLISSFMGGIMGQAKSASQDVVGGTSDESVRLSKALSYVTNQASSGSLGVSASTSSQIADQEKAEAALLAERQSQIGAAGDQLNSQLGDASKAALRGAGALSDRIAGMSSTYGGSIDGLMSSLDEASGSSKQGMNQLSAVLGGEASDKFTGIMQKLRGLNNNGVDAQEDFLNTILGPSRDNAGSGMAQVAALIQALSGLVGGQSSGQHGTLDTLRQFQLLNDQRMKNVTQALDAIRSLNGQLGDTVNAGGTQALADARARLIANMMGELNASKNSSSEGIGRIDQLIHSLVGGSLTQNLDKVGQTLASAGANLDASDRNFVQVERDQIKGLSGLSSLTASLLGGSSNIGLQQKAQTEASLANARANIVAKFKEIAANTTDTDLGNVMQTLAKQGNDTAIVQFLLGDVQTALKRINSDAVMARDSSDKKKADFEGFLAKAQAELQQAQADITAQLTAAVSQVQSELDTKINLIHSSEAEMNQSLADITAKVEKAQETLSKNLQIYQDKLDKIIDEIRSYMNLSTEADEMAIRRDIADQLGKVNATEVAISSANAAVANSIAQRNSSHSQTGSTTLDVVDGVINAVVETEGSVSDSHIGHSDKLISVAANVDAAATELDGSVKTAAGLIEKGIATSSDTAGRAISSAEGDQAKRVGQINDRAGQVSKESRKNFVASLEKMGTLDDDTLRVSRQLQDLIGNSDSAIRDVSESSMSHLDLSVSTMAKLNKAEVRKVASVSDVMGAFSAVMLGFLNETRSQMETIMNELNSVDAAAKSKLKEINTRSQDELIWVGNGLNSTINDFSQTLDHEQIIQQGLRHQLLKDETYFKSSEATKSSESTDIQDQVTVLKQRVTKHQADEISRVRDWISSRNPQIAQALFGEAVKGSFLQSTSRKSLIRDLNMRIRRVEDDLKELESTV
jgi:hypothetical protein